MMSWYHYVASFFAGAFLANAVPHFIHGISGNKFPTPFAIPPGRGLSSSVTNVLWAFFNIIIGIILAVLGVLQCSLLSVTVFLSGAFITSVALSIHFQKKDKD
jgi:hypothetical protein